MMRLVAIAAILGFAVSAQDTAGWISLFDGRTMDHWRDPRKFDPPGDAWTVEDGCLKARKEAHITEDLFSAEKYRDFELEWDWRVAPAGNSGVKYRIQKTVWMSGPHPPELKRFEDQVEWFLEHPVEKRPDRGQDYVIGWEYQMLDDARHPDAFAGKTHTTGALYDMVAPSEKAAKPAGEWNHSRLKVQGDHVEHWLNGVEVVDTSIAATTVKPALQKRWGKSPRVLELLGDQPERDCPISLQNHGADTWFRDIRIRRL